MASIAWPALNGQYYMVNITQSVQVNQHGRASLARSALHVCNASRDVTEALLCQESEAELSLLLDKPVTSQVVMSALTRWL